MVEDIGFGKAGLYRHFASGVGEYVSYTWLTRSCNKEEVHDLWVAKCLDCPLYRQGCSGLSEGWTTLSLGVIDASSYETAACGGVREWGPKLKEKLATERTRLEQQRAAW